MVLHWLHMKAGTFFLSYWLGSSTPNLVDQAQKFAEVSLYWVCCDPANSWQLYIQALQVAVGVQAPEFPLKDWVLCLWLSILALKLLHD